MILGQAQKFASPEEALAHISETSLPESRTAHDDIDFRVKPESPGGILEHYGTKGMRWGVRKENESSDRAAAKPLTPDAQQRIARITRTDRPQVLKAPPSGGSRYRGFSCNSSSKGR